MKHLSVILVLASLSLTSARAAENTDLCQDKASLAQAEKALEAIRLLADQEGFSYLISSSGYQTCNPTDFRTLPNPGDIARSQRAYGRICGAIFTFKNNSDMQDFVNEVRKDQQPAEISDFICVAKDFAQPLPSVSAGNWGWIYNSEHQPIKAFPFTLTRNFSKEFNSLRLFIKFRIGFGPIFSYSFEHDVQS